MFTLEKYNQSLYCSSPEASYLLFPAQHDLLVLNTRQIYTENGTASKPIHMVFDTKFIYINKNEYINKF